MNENAEVRKKSGSLTPSHSTNAGAAQHVPVGDGQAGDRRVRDQLQAPVRVTASLPMSRVLQEEEDPIRHHVDRHPQGVWACCALGTHSRTWDTSLSDSSRASGGCTLDSTSRWSCSSSPFASCIRSRGLMANKPPPQAGGPVCFNRNYNRYTTTTYGQGGKASKTAYNSNTFPV